MGEAPAPHGQRATPLALRLSEWSGGAGDNNLTVRARSCCLYGFYNDGQRLTNAWPAGSEKYHYCQMTACEVLLVFEISICGYEDFKSCCLRRRDQVTVLQLGPPAFVCSLDRVRNERLSKRRRRALIKKYLHSSGFECAASRVFEYCLGLLSSYAWKPIDELMQ